MACISAATGTFIFAVINIVLVTLSSLTGTGLMIFVAWSFFAHQPYHGPEMGFAMLNLFGAMALLTFLLVTLMFSSFLMHGVLNKKPQHIKAYFVFGVVVTILSVVASIIASALDSLYSQLLILILIGSWTIYSLILYMIRRTYTQYEAETGQYGHKPLAENC